MKVGTFLCNCGGSIKNIDWKELQNFIKKKADTKSSFVVYHENLCSQEGKVWLKAIYLKEKPDAIVFGGCTPKTAGYLFEDVLKEIGASPFDVVGANLREHVGWVTRDKNLATKKAKALVLGAFNKASHETHVEPQKIDMTNAAVIIGAGPAGLQAAQSLAERNHEIHLIDRNSHIGGNATKLGTFFPSEDCAACQLGVGVKGVHQPNVRRCYYRSAFDVHPKINLYMRSEVEDITGALGNYSVQVKSKPTYVKMEKCINCGLCSQACPVEKPDEHNLGLTTRKAVYLPSVTTSATKYVVNRDECPEGCTECMKACPIDAIDLNMQDISQRITAGGIILATGFQEYDPKLVEEYHYGEKGFENVLTQSELARFIDITGPTGGLIKKRNGDSVSSLVIINCVGSRSQKYNTWCSNICCMIGLKHAIAIKEKQPEIDITICYIDIRTVGPNYEEYYTKARELGVKFIRGRPSDIESDGIHFFINTEEAESNRPRTIEADMVTLSMAMVPSQGVQELAEKLEINIDKTGYFEELYAKLRTTETKQVGVFVAGAAIAPTDITTTVTHATAAAYQMDLILEKDFIEKRFPMAKIDNEKCTLCELCVIACPFGAIYIVALNNPGTKVHVNPTNCLGCGQCVASCPASAIDIDYYNEDQILSQLEGLLYDATDDPEPIIIVFSCWECAYASTDFVGQLGLTRQDMHYPHNVRILPIQCTGNLSAKMIQKTFSLGADGIIVLGCNEDLCHYETGSKFSSIRINLLKTILKSTGIDPRRLEKEFIYTANSNKFVSITKKMVDTIKKMGKLEL